jgi:hypothetical protein
MPIAASFNAIAMRIGFVCCSVLLSVICFERDYGQGPAPARQFQRSDFSSADSARLAKEYGENKTLIDQFGLQTLIALSYFPELKHTSIRFIYKSTRSPLTTRPLFPALLHKGRKRRFSITISDSSIAKLEPILLKSMDFNAQVGVLGHELSHVSDFSRRSFFSLMGSGISHVSSSYIDRFEFRTDSICIGHGLGYQLLSWSSFVRRTLHSENYDGSDNIDMPVMNRERYMNPSTIKARIAKDPLYSAL